MYSRRTKVKLRKRKHCVSTTTTHAVFDKEEKEKDLIFESPTTRFCVLTFRPVKHQLFVTTPIYAFYDFLLFYCALFPLFLYIIHIA